MLFLRLTTTLVVVSVLKVTCGFPPPGTGVAGALDEEASLVCLLNFRGTPLAAESSSAVLFTF